MRNWFRASLLGLELPFYKGLLGAGLANGKIAGNAFHFVYLYCERRHLAVPEYFCVIREHHYHVIS